MQICWLAKHVFEIKHAKLKRAGHHLDTKIICRWPTAEQRPLVGYLETRFQPLPLYLALAGIPLGGSKRVGRETRLSAIVPIPLLNTRRYSSLLATDDQVNNNQALITRILKTAASGLPAFLDTLAVGNFVAAANLWLLNSTQ